MKTSQQKWNEAHRDKVSAYHARWREKNRELIRIRGKEYRKQYGHVTRVKDLRLKYGITSAQYDTLFEAQNKRCAICGKTPEENGKYLSIDHCHNTKQVRGLLCYRCNTGLASFQDELSLVVNAVAYLQQAIAKAEGK